MSLTARSAIKMLQRRHSGGMVPPSTPTSNGKSFRRVLRSSAKIMLMANKKTCVRVGANGFGIASSSLYWEPAISLLSSFWENDISREFVLSFARVVLLLLSSSLSFVVVKDERAVWQWYGGLVPLKVDARQEKGLIVPYGNLRLCQHNNMQQPRSYPFRTSGSLSRGAARKMKQTHITRPISDQAGDAEPCTRPKHYPVFQRQMN